MRRLFNAWRARLWDRIAKDFSSWGDHGAAIRSARRRDEIIEALDIAPPLPERAAAIERPSSREDVNSNKACPF